MLRLIRRPIFWLIALALLALGSTGMVMANQAKAKKAAAIAAKPATSPFAAIANGKADVEGGIIAVAARRGGIIRDVLVQEGDQVSTGRRLGQGTRAVPTKPAPTCPRQRPCA